MLSSQRFVVLVALDYFGYVVDVVLGGVWVLLKCVQFLVFRERGNQLLQVQLLPSLPFLPFLASSLLGLALSFPLAFGLHQSLLLLPLLLHVPLHIRYLVLDEVQLLVQFQILLALLHHLLSLLAQARRTCVLCQLTSPPPLPLFPPPSFFTTSTALLRTPLALVLLPLAQLLAFLVLVRTALSICPP